MAGGRGLEAVGCRLGRGPGFHHELANGLLPACLRCIKSHGKRLPAGAVHALADPTNLVSCSVVNLWEIQIKASLGELDLRLPLAEVHAWIVEWEQWMLLPVRWEHIQGLDDLPSPHRDPFDRLLVAQAIAERLTLVSGDSVLRSYPVDSLD